MLIRGIKVTRKSPCPHNERKMRRLVGAAFGELPHITHLPEVRAAVRTLVACLDDNSTGGCTNWNLVTQWCKSFYGKRDWETHAHLHTYGNFWSVLPAVIGHFSRSRASGGVATAVQWAMSYRIILDLHQRNYYDAALPFWKRERQDALFPPAMAARLIEHQQEGRCRYGSGCCDDHEDPLFAGFVRDVFPVSGVEGFVAPDTPTVTGNFIRPEWRTDTVMALARTLYAEREYSAMPILADAVQDAGCERDDVLNHLRGPGPHCRGCWVLDAVLGVTP